MVGNELAVSVFVHPSLNRLDDTTHAPVAQSLARIYGKVMPFWYRARIQREHYIGCWLPEPFITHSTDNPLNIIELADSLLIAFLVLLEHLSPNERAIFLLREVFGYDYSAISNIVGKSPANCRQIMRRLRQRLCF